MRPGRILAALLVAGALAAPMVGHAQTTPRLVDGRDWQKSSIEEQRAYLIGVGNIIAIGARYDTKNGAADSFSLRAQKGLSGAHLAPAIETVNSWYRAHPDQLDKPVLSVIWRELAKPQLGEAK